MAKPTDYTPATVKKIIDALTAGNTRGASSAYAGISQRTFERWMKRYVAFVDAVKEAEAKAEVGHVLNIRQAASKGNWTASAWWLERRRHEDWGRKDKVEIVQTVREMARQAGLSNEEEEQAVAEAVEYLKGLRSGSRG